MLHPPPYYMLDPRRLLPAAATADWLGRFILDFRDPLADFTPDRPQRFTEGRVVEEDARDVQAEISRSQNASVSGALTDIVSVARGGGRSAGLSFQTGSMKIMRLSKYRDVFRTMREDVEIREYLSRALQPGGPVAYMIVGLLVWTDASLSVEQGRSREHRFDVQIPALAIGCAAAGIPLPLEIGDPGIAASSSNTKKTHLAMSVPGSYIVAIEYKAIRRKAYAIWPNPKPDWDGRGPRGAGDQSFNTHDEEVAGTEGDVDGESRPDDLVLDMDSDRCVWYDTVSGLDMEEIELESMVLAVETS